MFRKSLLVAGPVLYAVLLVTALVQYPYYNPFVARPVQAAPHTAQIAAALGAPGQTFKSGDVTVEVTCYGGTYIARTSVFSNQNGVTGGDIAMVDDGTGACWLGTPRHQLYVGGPAGPEIFCVGKFAVAITPIFTNQIGVSGGNIAVITNSTLCER